MTQPVALAALDPGERLLADWRSDSARYWRAHSIMAAVAATLAFGFFFLTGSGLGGALGGAFGGLLAIGARGAYLAGEQMRQHWRLTDRRVILPHGGSVALAEIENARLILGDLQLITRAGDKHLVKFPADGAAALAAVTTARDRRARRSK